METILPEEEALEYEEFKRARRETAVTLMLKRVLIDASRRETDRPTLKNACDMAAKLGCGGILVSPVRVSWARRNAKRDLRVVALVGGTGETLPAVKKTEAKKALSQGADEVRLVPCYSALFGHDLDFLKREVKKVRRAARKAVLTLSLEDHALGKEEIALGVRAAVAGGADGVCVRGEPELVLHAMECAAGKLVCDASGTQNGEQMSAVLRAGAVRVTTANAAALAEELFSLVRLPS